MENREKKESIDVVHRQICTHDHSALSTPGTSAVTTPTSSNRTSRPLTSSSSVTTPNSCSQVLLTRHSSAVERSNRRARYQVKTWVFFALFVIITLAIARVTHICMEGVYEYQFESHPILRIVNKICRLK